MSYKTILVHAGPDPALEQRARAAASIGARYGAALIGAGAIGFDPTPYMDPGLGYLDGGTVEALRSDVDAAIQEAETRFRAAVSGYVHPVVWRTSTDYPDRAMAGLAAGADLVVTCRPPAHVDDRRFPRPGSLIMETGLPVLVLAPGVEQLHPHTVMIAWKDSRETRRAVADALPFLKAAERVTVVAIREHNDDETTPRGLDDLVARLARHGVNAQRDVLPHLEEFVSEDLLDIAESRKADLVVLGAYGHSRLREWAFGGVTADLLQAANRSLLFSR